MPKPSKTALAFILLSLFCLLGGALFGCIAAFQFVYPDFARFLPFFKNRPLHVSLMLAWIFLGSIGGIYCYLPAVQRGFWKTLRMQNVHLILCIITGACILVAYLLGLFGGREYWEYPPILSIGILIAWLIFAVNFFLAAGALGGRWPAYVWMWATGVVFFLFAFGEAHLWLLPIIRNDPIRDITVQWKAYGSLIGSWNMLVYGTALYVMGRISGDETVARSKTAFALYLLGLVNLLFGWAHHIYVVPINPWIRNIAYLVSMSEWILFLRIIFGWNQTLSTARKHLSIFPYRFILASEFWILANILIALLISIPAINIYTHGTHVTVAHAMGSTIGINTMILLASAYYIAYEANGRSQWPGPSARWGWILLNGSLFVFILMLVLAGIGKGVAMAHGASFSDASIAIAPAMQGFAFSGLFVFVALCMVAMPLIVKLMQTLVTRD